MAFGVYENTTVSRSVLVLSFSSTCCSKITEYSVSSTGSISAIEATVVLSNDQIIDPFNSFKLKLVTDLANSGLSAL